MKPEDVATTDPANAKRAYMGPKGKSKKRHTLKLKPRRSVRPRGREGY